MTASTVAPTRGLDPAALERTCRAEETLPAAFPDAREQFQAFQSTQLDLLSLMDYHKFAQGFAMGMQRAVGAIHDKEDTPPRSDPPACPPECCKKSHQTYRIQSIFKIQTRNIIFQLTYFKRDSFKISLDNSPLCIEPRNLPRSSQNLCFYTCNFPPYVL